MEGEGGRQKKQEVKVTELALFLTAQLNDNKYLHISLPL